MKYEVSYGGDFNQSTTLISLRLDENPCLIKYGRAVRIAHHAALHTTSAPAQCIIHPTSRLGSKGNKSDMSIISIL